LEPDWNPIGFNLEFQWNTFGNQLEPPWNSAGTHLEPVWTDVGNPLELIWNPFETTLECHGTLLGTPLEPLWKPFQRNYIKCAMEFQADDSNGLELSSKFHAVSMGLKSKCPIPSRWNRLGIGLELDICSFKPLDRQC